MYLFFSLRFLLISEICMQCAMILCWSGKLLKFSIVCHKAVFSWSNYWLLSVPVFKNSTVNLVKLNTKLWTKTCRNKCIEWYHPAPRFCLSVWLRIIASTKMYSSKTDFFITHWNLGSFSLKNCQISTKLWQ